MEPCTLLDAHVHIYDRYPLANFLDSACQNFKKAAEKLGVDGDIAGILLLTETSRDHWFSRLQRLADGIVTGEFNPHDWRFEHTDEPCSLAARRGDRENLNIIAGRQIVTSERLEVLAIGADREYPEGLPLHDVIELVRESGALPVIPWGFGKWTGSRGKVVRQVLVDKPGADLFLGDNGGRMRYWLEPTQFKLARKNGIRILPGSDPLPFASEYRRPGSYGFMLNAPVSSMIPGADIKKYLVDREVSITPYGRREGFLRFMKNQLSMQLVKYLG